jgi:predicted enzyme related to lactoylglutathione lyase
MIKNFEGLLLFSEDAKKLADFYGQTVGLSLQDEMVMGENDDEAFMFSTGNNGGPTLTIMKHSEVKGANKMPERVIFNLEVDDIEKETKRLKDAGVKIIQDIYHIQDFGQIATFADPDNNYFQFVQNRASKT